MHLSLLPSYINVLSTQVVSVISLYDEEEESESDDEKIHIKSIPPPMILSFSGINPHLREIKSSNMLNFSMELSVSWDHPQFKEINSYEIYFGVGNKFRVYDHLHEEKGLVCTWISYNICMSIKLGLRFTAPLPSHRMYLQIPQNLATTSIMRWIRSL